jgi:hypothetical protein
VPAAPNRERALRVAARRFSPARRASFLVAVPLPLPAAGTAELEGARRDPRPPASGLRAGTKLLLPAIELDLVTIGTPHSSFALNNVVFPRTVMVATGRSKI